jgi:hypothetical protein
MLRKLAKLSLTVSVLALLAVFFWSNRKEELSVVVKEATVENKKVESVKRKLIRDTGSNGCWNVDYNKGYEDYVIDPFKANDNRGDWGTYSLILVE